MKTLFYLLFMTVASIAETVNRTHGWNEFWDYALDLEGPAGHSHESDTSLDGSCVACVGARRIYCLDGDENNANLEDESQGSCKQSWGYCTWGG